MSVVLSQNQTNEAGLSLKWVISGMQAPLKEITLIYYKSANDSSMNAMLIDPDQTNISLDVFDAGTAYYLQLQVTDANDATVYSNLLNVTTPNQLVAPVISSIVGLDNALQVTLASSANQLSTSDFVEFVLRKSDNSLFWMVKPWNSSRIYTLSNADNNSLYNNHTYRVACMYQPAPNNATYKSPSAISNTVDAEPSNLPNAPQNVAISSVGSSTLDVKLAWNRPSDFNEWSNNFQIKLGLEDNLAGVFSYVTLNNQDVVEYTWSDLARGKQYRASVQYINTYRAGDEAVSSYILPTSVPDAPVLISVVEGNGQLTLNWSAPSFDGNSAITNYNIYKNSAGNNPVLLTIFGNVLTYTDTAVTNGIQYFYPVRAKNNIGDSPASNAQSGMPFGDMSIQSVVASNKQLTITILPNGRPIEQVFIVAVDDDPDHLTDGTFFMDIPQQQIPQDTSGSIQLVKSFTGFTSAINFWCVIGNNAVNSAFLKSN